MVNYNKSSIYKLCCKDVNIKEEYVGSTTRFERRKAEHKTNCLNKNIRAYNFNVYNFIRENGGMGNWDMIQIEEVNVNSKRELETRERYWIEFLKAELNSNIPSRTKKDWYVDNREFLIEKQKKNSKEYYKYNREVIAEKQKEYRENNKEVFLKKEKEYRENNREVIAEKRKEHVENKKEYDKEYRLKNKDKIDEKIECECGSEVNKRYLSKHKKTKKHLNFIDQSREQTSDSTVESNLHPLVNCVHSETRN